MAGIYLAVGLLLSICPAIPLVELALYIPNCPDPLSISCFPCVIVPAIGFGILTVVNAIRVLIGHGGRLLIIRGREQTENVDANRDNI